jgi:hypothetical protein
MAVFLKSTAKFQACNRSASFNPTPLYYTPDTHFYDPRKPKSPTVILLRPRRRDSFWKKVVVYCVSAYSNIAHFLVL